MLRAAVKINARQHHILAAKISTFFDGKLDGRTIALWGLAFKANTDDTREAPSISVINALTAAGARQYLTEQDTRVRELAGLLRSKSDDVVERVRALLEERPALPFIEVHSENYFAEGGAARALLRAARETYPVSLHGVGLALGSAVGLDDWHLDRLAALVREVDPVRVSDHACFARARDHCRTIVIEAVVRQVDADVDQFHGSKVPAAMRGGAACLI